MRDFEVVVWPNNLVDIYEDFEKSKFSKFFSSFSSVEDFLVWLFRERCVICGERYRVIHEINPRSSGEGSMNWKNRITLCNKCHHTIHHLGTGENEIEELKQKRIKFLEQIGRSEYA